MNSYSIIKFGSQMNRHFDRYSDKDLLVVSDSRTGLRYLYQKYSNDGWSVSAYTYAKLQHLSNSGSLFIEHLIKDAKIIIDSKNQFASIILNHVQKTDYNEDLIEAKEFFRIIARIPENNLGYAWFCDCFYVGLRNYLIFQNALKAKYEFSYLSLIQNLLDEKLIDKIGYSLLRELRVAKFNYRQEFLDELPSRSFVAKLIKIGRDLGLLEKAIFVDNRDFKKVVMIDIAENFHNGYQRLRLVEGIYCSYGVNIPIIKHIVSNPQFYSSKLMDDKFLYDLIDKLRLEPQDNLLHYLLGH